jgi:plasmid stabilization system protein ParE
MPFAVRITDQALAEVEDILEWMQERSPAAAARWYADLMTKVRTLENNPKRCGLSPEGDRHGVELRQILVGKRRGTYRVLFTVDDAGSVVNVVHIRHGARDFLGRDEL